MLKALPALAALALGCGEPALPDPDAAGAAVFRTRCAGCHRLYPPGTMTAAMWKMQLARMHVEFARRGLPWLPPEEERALTDYLSAHAGTS